MSNAESKMAENMRLQEAQNLTKLLMDNWSTGKVHLPDFKHTDYSQYW